MDPVKSEAAQQDWNRRCGLSQRGTLYIRWFSWILGCTKAGQKYEMDTSGRYERWAHKYLEKLYGIERIHLGFWRMRHYQCFEKRRTI